MLHLKVCLLCPNYCARFLIAFCFLFLVRAFLLFIIIIFVNCYTVEYFFQELYDNQ